MPKWKAEASMKNYDLLTYVDRHYVTNLLPKSVLKISTIAMLFYTLSLSVSV